MNWKTLIAITVSTAVSLSLLPGCGAKANKTSTSELAARPVKLFTVGSEEDSSYHFYPAKIRSGQRVKLAFQVSGQIIKFPVKSGNSVASGELLGELDPRDYENTLKSATSRYRESKTDFERQSNLLEKQVVSVAVFESKRKTFEVAEAEMKIAEKALADTRLLAPFNGVVASTYVDNFQNIQAKQEILSLQGTDDIELIVNVPEKDIIHTPAALPLSKINEMLSPVAIFPALNNLTFPLKLKEYETEADPATQTFRGILTMQTPREFSIMPGMTAIVRTTSKQEMGEKTGHWIPATAVAEDNNGQRYVWTVDKNMTIHKGKVTVGTMDEDRIMVTGGLMKGATIVVAGISFLSEGMSVKALTHIGGREVNRLTGEL